MRREELYLADMVDAADSIHRFLSGVTKKQFMDDEILSCAVLQKLTVIGEAASRLSATFRKTHVDVEWRDIVAFRNIAVHAYFAVDWGMVWIAATQDVPTLRECVQSILLAEYPPPPFVLKAEPPRKRTRKKGSV